MRNAVPVQDEPRRPEAPLVASSSDVADALDQFLTASRRGCGRERVDRAFADGPRGDPLRDLLAAGERLGVPLHAEPATPGRLEQLAPPFIVIDPRTGAAHCVEGRLGGELFFAGDDRAPHHLRGFVHPEMAVVTAEGLDGGDPAPAVVERIRQRLRPVFAEIAIASVVINILALATPLFMMTVYNKVIGHGALRTLDVLAIGMVTLFLFDAGLRLLRSYVVSHAGARIDAAVGADLVHHLLHLPLRALERLTPGHMVEQLRQVDNLRLFFTGQVPLLWVDLGFVVLFVGVIALLAPPLALITVAAIPLLVASSAWAGRRQRRIMRDGFKAAADKASAVGETVTNALTIKALGLEAEMARGFDDKLAGAADAGFRAGQLNGTAQTVGLLLQHVVTVVLVYVGAHLIVAGELSVGALIAATILSARALAPMRQLAGAWHQLHAVKDAMAAIDGLLARAEPAKPATMSAPTLHGHLRLERVSYRYDGHGAALQDIDLAVEPGGVLALVGPPGSGKTTLTKLLLGLLTPSDGRVLVDGFDLRHLPGPEVLRQVGYVPQETQLFRGSIAYNIGLGVAHADTNRIVGAARFTGLHDVVEALPEGYATVLGDGRFNLSAGQRQLLALARAMIRNPRILILDEATSALDGASERRLVERLRPVTCGRTVVIVTHRPALLALADRAVRLEAGRLVDAGEVAEVLAREAGAPAPAAAT
ncbi:MAG: peptidase domain-containing ABC transporter [Alphaproteobacteria bacterium]